MQPLCSHMQPLCCKRQPLNNIRQPPSHDIGGRRQGRSLKIRRAVLAQLLGVLGQMYNYFYIFCSASDFSH